MDERVSAGFELGIPFHAMCSADMVASAGRVLKKLGRRVTSVGSAFGLDESRVHMVYDATGQELGVAAVSEKQRRCSA